MSGEAVISVAVIVVACASQAACTGAGGCTVDCPDNLVSSYVVHCV